jgi:hypothetical protein
MVFISVYKQGIVLDGLVVFLLDFTGLNSHKTKFQYDW